MSGANNHECLASGDPTIRRRNVRVTTIAEKRLTSTPIASVSANPLTRAAPNWSPNHQRIPQVIRVDTLLSRMDDQARSKPCSIAGPRLRPARSSSFSLSKTRTFASTAIPTESTNPAMPASDIVTGSPGNSLNTIITVDT